MMAKVVLILNYELDPDPVKVERERVAVLVRRSERYKERYCMSVFVI